jgi:hypothetical protein
MVASRNSATTGTVSNPAWRRGYDAGINAERRAIVAWLRGKYWPAAEAMLRDQGWRALSDSADYIERGVHLRDDDE